MGLNSDGSFSLRVGAELFTSEGLSYQANNWYRLTASWSEPNANGLRLIELRVRNLTTGTNLNGGSPVVSINREVIDPATWYGLGLLVNRGLIDSIGVEERGFTGWMENRFPGLTGGFDGDDDGDGIANGFEYIFGLNPTQIDPSTSAPSPILTTDSLSLSIPELRRAEDVLVEVESSTDLITWDPVQGEFLSNSINFSTLIENEPKKFLRYRLTVPE